MRRLVLAFALLAIGCRDDDRPLYQYPARIECHRCGRLIYEGPINVYRGGFTWPAGPMKHCAQNQECRDLARKRGWVLANDDEVWRPDTK